MITKKEFKTKCSFHEYGRGKNKINTIYFDWHTSHEGNFAGYKYMVNAAVCDCKKDELLQAMYNWVIKEDQLIPYYIDYKYAATDKDRFKVQLTMKVKNS